MTWSAIALIIVTGGIHVYEAPDSFSEAAYKGWLFYANGAGALLAAYGILRDRQWGWYLGVAVAAGSFLAYIASRTVGLPLLAAEPDAWFEPLGISSFIAEGLFIALFVTRVMK